jgi:hypothetical protein
LANDEQGFLFGECFFCCCFCFCNVRIHLHSQRLIVQQCVSPMVYEE